MKPTLSIDPTDPEILWILGLMCFQCGPIAEVLRYAGEPIPRKAESEQAIVMIWLIQKYQEHGEGWRSKVQLELNNLSKMNTATSQKTSDIALTREQIDILHHTEHRAAGGFYCGGGTAMASLVAAGLMQSVGRKSFVPDDYFCITSAGRAALRAHNKGKQD